MELRLVPDLADLARQPEKVAGLSPAEAQALIAPLTALLAALWLRLSVPAPAAAPVPVPVSEWCDAEQAHTRFGLSPTWLHEHRKPLEKLGIVSRASRKMVLYDVKRLRSYLEHRRATSPLRAEDGPAVHLSQGGQR